MKTIRFGIIGCGLMGREFASAVGRWCHLVDMDVRPEIVAICDRNPARYSWYRDHFSTLTQATDDYEVLLADPKVDAVYVALPHHLHREVYCRTIEAGKHLMAEKPFGIDEAACRAIVACAAKHPEVMVRCSSEFPFFPGVQRIGQMIEAGAFGHIIEVNTGFLHSSDLDPNKPITWKRQVEFCGEYGVMGDLGMHACHVPFRAGWIPCNVRAILSDIVHERPVEAGSTQLACCSTWENAILLCEAVDPKTKQYFPWTCKVQRIAPGQRDNWYVEILGTKASVRWSSAEANMLEVLEYESGKEQAWCRIQIGYEPAFKTITGNIFQFGFTDSVLQMWGAYLYELTHGRPVSMFAGCVTPEEATLSHSLFTAALRSQAEKATFSI